MAGGSLRPRAAGLAGARNPERRAGIRASDKVVVAVQVVFSGLWRVRGRRAFPFLYGVWVCPFPGGAGSRVRGLVTVREGFCAGLVTVRPGGVSLRAGQRGPG